MKFKKLIEGFDWWNEEIKDTSTGKILYKNTKELLDVVEREFNAMSDEEIINIIGGKTSNLKMGGAYFVTSRGDIISVGEAISRDLYIHMDYFKAIVAYIYYNLEGSENFPDFYEVYDIFRLRFDEMFQSLTYNRHWCRFNCGNTETEGRVYCVLPPVVPTYGQCDALEMFLINGSSRQDTVGVYVVTGEDLDDSDYHKYSFKEHTPEEIIKLIKRYYASGEFYESIKNFYRDTLRFPMVENSEEEIIFNRDAYEPIVIGGEEYSDNDRECEIYYGIIYDNKHIGNVAIDINTIEGFEIYPEFEGQGLGRKTIKSLLEKHPEINFVESTPQAKQFWEKCGFNVNYYNDDSGLYNMSLSESLNEKIVKIGSKWQVQSEKGRNMGTYDTKAEAEKRLQQVHYFKYKNKEQK